jgi:hypothetical protein
MKLKYGLRFSQDDESRTHLHFEHVKNIPPLFLAIQQSDLKELLQNMDFNVDSSLSDLEKKVVERMITKMKAQIEEFNAIEERHISFDAVNDFLRYLETRLVELTQSTEN